ncbi:MAG: transglycosylase, partial [Leptothrix sp. (in: b-proteobacteria)]
MSMLSELATSTRRTRRLAWAGAILGSLMACSSAPPFSGPAPSDAPTAPIATAPALPGVALRPSEAAIRPTARGRWVRGDWADLPGWRDDNLVLAWPAWLRS